MKQIEEGMQKWWRFCKIIVHLKASYGLNIGILLDKDATTACFC